MQIPSILLIVGLEIVLALILVCLLGFFHLRKLRRLLNRQQEQLRQSLEAPAADNQTPNPLDHQLKSAYKHFYDQEPEADINTPSRDLSPSAQLAAIHYHLLSHLGPEAAEGTWEQADEKLHNLLETQASDETAPELAQAQKRIQNLEKFKKLFFDMEQQWEHARSEAQQYYEQLMAMSAEVEDPEKFNQLLNQYNSLYDDIHQHFTSAVSAPTDTGQSDATRLVTVTRADPRTAEELNKLRNVAADQHKIIGKLQKQLQDAQSAEEKEAVIQQLQGQLEQQLRYVKESETCVQLLESELEATISKLNELENQQEGGADKDQEIEEMRATLHQFTLETKDLLLHLETLEKENLELKDTTNRDDSPALSQLQQSYTELQAQYTELEERYLELRSKGST
ncbi:hypothetical protein [Gilvimarinus sp. DA14]|uniref:hypothetical protein n=1 Tax=Gilvimarinus sp. DA14 TaxID=2956798 RepID=UPI0020B6D42C|nr:hypothetical protein [Gilvimarinus sp. DA14]UTF61363.1 hypothetical protein NHM04_06065 [Gilvimarinus sp. DA14]